MMKKVISLILITVASAGLFALGTFSGETGGAVKFINTKASSFDPAIQFDGFLTGQYSLLNSLFVRGDFSLQTDDLTGGEVTDEKYSFFKINEVSITNEKASIGRGRTLTLFIGNLESIGSQQFVSRRLGTENYASHLTESYLGSNGSFAYGKNAYGGSYSQTFIDIPVSTGIVISKTYDNSDEDDENTEDEEDSQISADFRLATAFRYLTMDLLIGGNAPISRKNSDGEDVYLLIDEIYLHGGIDILLGNVYSPISLYFLAGYDNFPVKSSSEGRFLKSSEAFALAELRLGGDGFYFNVTGWNIPSKKLENMLFINETLGCNFGLMFGSLNPARKKSTFGIDLTVSYDDATLDTYYDIEDKNDYNFKLCPYFDFETENGKVKIYSQVNLKKLGDEEKAIKLFLGYKRKI